MQNRIYDAFDAVEPSEELKNGTKEYLAAQREKAESKTRRKRKPIFYTSLGAVCAVLVMFIGIGGYSFMNTPTSYVSIDVNPSVELTLNRLDKVIEAKAYNDDGKIILENIDVKGMVYTEAVDNIVESDEMAPYLTKDSDLTFTVASKDESKEKRLVFAIEKSESCKNHNGQGVSANKDLVEDAHENGMSLGKYVAYLTLKKYDKTVTVEDCHDMTMKELHTLIGEHDGTSSHGGGNESCGSSGNGHGYGNGEELHNGSGNKENSCNE